MDVSSAHDWCLINRRMVAKAIAELNFEEVVAIVPHATGFRMDLKCGVSYRFKAWMTIWNFPRIDADSLERRAAHDGPWQAVFSAGQFFLDSQAETGMDDIILGNFLEEMQRTLFADLKLLQVQRRYTVAEMIAMDGDSLQGLLDGHPKALLNKGRVGWGSSDIKRYAPESFPAFQLFWVAVHHSAAQFTRHPHWTRERLLAESLQEPERLRLEQFWMRTGLDWDQYELMPLHPWQWEHVIEQQFAEAIVTQELVPLGSFGDRYRPQTSLRTMSNVDRPERLQLKLALSILNTSCVRGLPAQYVSIAPELAQWLADLCEADELLQNAGTKVLRDIASVHCQHRIFGQVKEAPYRYHEYLGAVWREHPKAQLEDDEQAVLTAAFFQKDYLGESLLAQWIHKSGLDIPSWLKAYAERVIVPLYHLQCKYGVGVVAHGQNIVLRLRKGRPVGLFLKDLQGDLRLVDEDLPELQTLAPSIRQKLTRLPAHHLIQDLQTGHLITVLRFMSATLQEATGFAEQNFYQIIAVCLQNYQKRQDEIQDRFQSRSLLKASMPRILINRVRFQIGYADHAERPRPTLGTELLNPLHRHEAGDHHVSAYL
jgi:aerobactin synthase